MYPLQVIDSIGTLAPFLELTREKASVFEKPLFGSGQHFASTLTPSHILSTANSKFENNGKGGLEGVVVIGRERQGLEEKQLTFEEGSRSVLAGGRSLSPPMQR